MKPVSAQRHRSTKWRPWLALVALVLFAGCARFRKQHTPEEARHAAGSLLSGKSAFELAARPNGARLLWAPDSGGIWQTTFALDGSEDGVPSELVPKRELAGVVGELGVLETRERMAFAWLSKRFRGASLHAAEGSPNGPFRAIEVAKSQAQVPSERGQFALGLDRMRGGVSLLARTGAAECVDTGRRDCDEIGWWRLSEGRAENRGLSLSVPSPCRERAVSLLNEPRGMHYAVCSDGQGENKERTTTLFTIQNQPQYARADTPLRNCNPLGLFDDAGNVWLVSDCGGRRRAARVGADNAPLEERELSSPRFECVSGRARLRAGPVEFFLSEPRDGLAPLLPTTLAPRDSRAVWTGTALLVARPRDRKLEILRYVCESNLLRQVPLAKTPAPEH